MLSGLLTCAFQQESDPGSCCDGNPHTCRDHSGCATALVSLAAPEIRRLPSNMQSSSSTLDLGSNLIAKNNNQPEQQTRYDCGKGESKAILARRSGKGFYTVSTVVCLRACGSKQTPVVGSSDDATTVARPPKGYSDTGSCPWLIVVVEQPLFV